MKISQSTLHNRVFTSDALRFDPQLSGHASTAPHFANHSPEIPPAVEIQPDGTALCRFYAPKAKTVSVGHILGEQVPLTKDENGIWSGTLSAPFPGFKVITWEIDGVQVLNPYAPIGFGYGRPVNYIDIPSEDQDYLTIKDVPHGSVTREYYKSSVTGEYESCLVYLPPCFREEPGRKYPTLYLQHGGSQNENTWVYEGKINFIMDNLLAEGKAVPCIIVMNNGMVQVKGEDGCFHYDSDKLQQLLIEDCIPFIDSRYPTLEGAWNRAFAGLSMGSLQGGKFFFERRDIIASAGLFTGFEYPNTDTQPDYLKALDEPESFNKTSRLFFIAVGENEPSYEAVRRSSERCTQKGIQNLFRAYPGGHEWYVWRAAAHEFLQLVFK